jgi:hypothetical protein
MLDLQPQLNQREIKGEAYHEEQLKHLTEKNNSNASQICEISGYITQADLCKQIYQWKATETYERRRT